MKNSIKTVLICLILFSLIQTQLFSQAKIPKKLARPYTSPQELVSMSRTMTFDDALDILNNLTKKFEKKIIINTSGFKETIGIDIDQMHYLDALETILNLHGLIYEEFPEYYQILPGEAMAAKFKKEPEVDFETREVVISAVFFEADGSILREMGMSWDVFRGNDVNIQGNMSAADSKTSVLNITGSPALDFGSLVATFKALESNAMGEVVASPQVTVRSKQPGRIQVGSDIGVTTQDFAGNTVTQFFSTGSIIKVTPEVLQHDSTYFIHLDIIIERSNTSNSQIGLEIKKTQAETSVLLLDGEETIIGGLYITEESRTREGVPVLKDLPWWFFGLKYLFGFDSKKLIKKELIILIKAELLPTLAERLALKSKQKGIRPVLLEQRLKFIEKMRYLQKQNKHYKP